MFNRRSSRSRSKSRSRSRSRSRERRQNTRNHRRLRERSNSRDKTHEDDDYEVCDEEFSRRQTIVRIPPNHYLHVQDQNTNVTRVVTGPQTFVRQDNQRIARGPCMMVIVPPRHYCIVENPVIFRSGDGDAQCEPLLDNMGQAKLRHGELEIRFAREPFPLYPGEVLKNDVEPLKVVEADTALKVRAVLDYDEIFEDDDTDRGSMVSDTSKTAGSKTVGGKGKRVSEGRKGDASQTTESERRVIHRTAGDVWLFEGPGTFIPRIETVIESTIIAAVIGPNQALCLRAKRECVDKAGKKHVTGEKWLVKEEGAYLPGVFEEVVDIIDAHVLSEQRALHVRARKTFVDDYNIRRKNGEEWLVTLDMTEAHIPGVYEEVVAIVNQTTLTCRQYCVILDPVSEDGKPQYGKRKLVRGESSFFLQPGEKMEKGIQNVYVLGEEEGLVLRAIDKFVDNGTDKDPGDRWMIRGPVEYVPPVEVEVLMRRRAIPLDEGEGIYIRDIKTGNVRAVKGGTYMIKEYEELWEKHLSETVEALLVSQLDPLADRSNRGPLKKSGEQQENEGLKISSRNIRDKTRVVTFRVPHNAACQIYDYRDKRARVVYGPELVMLGPDEEFTRLSLSGGKPKKQNIIQSLCLLLGPDFATDVITVETSDHARLSLQLSYNWHFDVTEKSPATSAKLFSVPDFIGDFCKAIASRIRGAVAQTLFDEFHKHSVRILRVSVFGWQDDKIAPELRFEQNNLVVTSIDVQSVEPVDQRTRDALQKSVQMAIEITTKSQEAAARQEAERMEQEARGRLERQKIQDEAQAEEARRKLLELQAQSAAVESTGQAKAEAQSRAESCRIEGETSVEQARLKAQAMAIEAEAELKRLSDARAAELQYQETRIKQEIFRQGELNDQEIKKFQDMVASLGSDAIVSMATAGTVHQRNMLSALGLKSTLITDGSSPINLLSTAAGLIGFGEPGASSAKRRKIDEHGEGHSEAGDDHDK